MSKVVASVYALGVIGASAFAVGTVASLISGYTHYSPLGWVSGIAISGVPLGTLLYAGAVAEWQRKDISSSAMAFVIIGTALLVLVGFFAHTENVAAALSSLQAVVCLFGYLVIKRSKKLSASAT